MDTLEALLKVELTQDEITLLFEALDVWEKVPNRKAYTDTLITVMTSQGREEEAVKKVIEESAENTQRQELARKRRSVLLKAKLILAAEQAVTEDLFNARLTLKEIED